MSGAFYGESSATINWNNGNVQTTSAAPGTLTFATGTMINGAAYTLVLNNVGGGGIYTLSSADVTTWKCLPGCSSNQITAGGGKDTVLTILKAGTVA